MIYLDSAATTPMSLEVLNAMVPYMTSEFGNPNSIHSLGVSARKAVDKAREQVAALINANPSQIVFTSGGSEANNLAIKGCGKLYAMSSSMEHTSSLRSLEAAMASTFYVMDEKYDYYNFVGDVEHIRFPMRAEDFIHLNQSYLVWKMFVNNELGILNPVYDLGLTCSKYKDILFGCDCVQALGFEEVDVKEMRCDFASMSSHKIHGPKGVGALYAKDLDSLHPLIGGGVNQEFGIRGGTENVAGIVGFGQACEIAMKNREKNKSKILLLRNLFLEHIDGVNYKLNCSDQSKILSIQLPGIDAETFVLVMSSLGVAISAGSACRNLEAEANGALIAYGLTETEARNTIRISFMETLTENDIINAAEKFKAATKILKE